MKKTTLLASCFALLLSFTACEGPAEKKEAEPVVKAAAVDMTKVRSEIQAIENDWAAAMMKKDVNALMALYTDDAQSLQDGGPTLNGQAAIKAHQEASFAKPPSYASISFQTQDVYGSPDEVTEVGTSTEKDAAGKVTATGKYVAVFKKVGGSYKCVREIYNRDSK